MRVLTTSTHALLRKMTLALSPERATIRSYHDRSCRIYIWMSFLPSFFHTKRLEPVYTLEPRHCERKPLERRDQVAGSAQEPGASNYGKRSNEWPSCLLTYPKTCCATQGQRRYVWIRFMSCPCLCYQLQPVLYQGSLSGHRGCSRGSWMLMRDRRCGVE